MHFQLTTQLYAMRAKFDLLLKQFKIWVQLVYQTCNFQVAILISHGQSRRKSPPVGRAPRMLRGLMLRKKKIVFLIYSKYKISKHEKSLPKMDKFITFH